MTSTMQRLEARRNLSALYELVIEHCDEKYLVQYCKRSRQSILRGIHKHGEEIASRYGDILTFAKRAGDGAYIGEWHVHFTGRTEREAIGQGELPTAW